MARNSGNRSSNSNRGGNRQSDSWYQGGVDTARESPFRTAAVAAAAVGAGAFLWSRRNQISDQISQLSDQISEWASSMNSGGSSSLDDTGGLTTGSAGTDSSAGRTSRSKGSRPTMTEGASATNSATPTA